MIHPGKGHAATAVLQCNSGDPGDSPAVRVDGCVPTWRERRRGSYLPHERISPRSGPEGRALHAASNPPAAAAGSGRASGTLTSAAD